MNGEVTATRYSAYLSLCYIMLSLTKAILFFWNIVCLDTLKMKKELTTRIMNWRCSVTGPRKKVHTHTSSHFSSLLTFGLL